MSFPLTLIPFQPPARDLVRAFTARAERTEGGLLQIHYRLEADVARLCVSAQRESRRVDELWKHTCFEAFVADPRTGAAGGDGDSGYRELNFAPSTEWAAYAFTGYRAGMAPISMAPPQIRVEAAADRLELIARFDPGAADGSPTGCAGRHKLSLTAVLEDDAGALTYWALRHAPDRPDFHHPAGFILEV